MPGKPFTTWLAKAKMHETLVYHRDGETRNEKDFIAAYNAHCAGSVFLALRRTNGVLEWTATYCRRQDRALLDRVSAGIKVAPSSDFLLQAA